MEAKTEYGSWDTLDIIELAFSTFRLDHGKKVGTSIQTLVVERVRITSLNPKVYNCVEETFRLRFIYVDFYQSYAFFKIKQHIQKAAFYLLVCK